MLVITFSLLQIFVVTDTFCYIYLFSKYWHMFVVIAYIFCTRGYNILLKYWCDTNLSVEWIGLGPRVQKARG
jgi:hypothetical protein